MISGSKIQGQEKEWRREAIKKKEEAKIRFVGRRFGVL